MTAGRVAIGVGVLIAALALVQPAAGVDRTNQGVFQLRTSKAAVVDESEVGIDALDATPHFRYADRNVDATLLEDLTDMLIQTQARLVREHCKLFGNWFGYVVQLALGAVVAAALIVKKYTDKKPRNWMTWLRDTSKQGVGAIVAHLWNLLFATLLAQSRLDDDPCVYYLVNYLVDAILGSILSVLLLWACETMADRYGWQMLRSGDYGSGLLVVWQRWAAQMSLWCAIVTLAKLVLLFCLIIPAKHPLYVAGAWMMSGLANYPRLELVIVMILIPLVLNIITFWIVDGYLMNSDETNGPIAADDPLQKGKDLVQSPLTAAVPSSSSASDSGLSASSEKPIVAAASAGIVAHLDRSQP